MPAENSYVQPFEQRQFWVINFLNVLLSTFSQRSSYYKFYAFFPTYINDIFFIFSIKNND